MQMCVCAQIWPVQAILCLLFWFSLSVFTSVCVHLSFTLIMGRIAAVCVQTAHRHILSNAKCFLHGEISLYEIVVVHHVRFTCQMSITLLLFPGLLLVLSTRGQQSPFQGLQNK